jgi:class 3 adenylate cyclase
MGSRTLAVVQQRRSVAALDVKRESMALKDDLTKKVREFAVETWGEIPNGYTVPSPETLTLGNTGSRINACVLYADIHRSTEMVDQLRDERAAEYYKAFLHCAAKIIKFKDGEITAYDGDRVMAIFMGDDQAPRACTAAFHINSAMMQIINPQFATVYTTSHRALQHTVGIDCGRLLAAKSGVRNDTDLVWVGPAANYAAKLNSFDGLDPAFSTRITKAVFDKLPAGYFYKLSGQPVWNGPYINLAGHPHYRSDMLIELG